MEDTIGSFEMEDDKTQALKTKEKRKKKEDFFEKMAKKCKLQLAALILGWFHLTRGFKTQIICCR